MEIDTFKIDFFPLLYWGEKKIAVLQWLLIINGAISRNTAFGTYYQLQQLVRLPGMNTQDFETII